MSDVIRVLLLVQTPMWLTLVLAGAVLFLLWRLRVIWRVLDSHATSIAHMDDWADETEERLERIDWVKHHRSPANDMRHWWRHTA